MENYNYNGSTEYEKAIHFLEIGCNCGCSKKISREILPSYARRFKLSLDLNKTYF